MYIESPKDELSFADLIRAAEKNANPKAFRTNIMCADVGIARIAIMILFSSIPASLQKNDNFLPWIRYKIILQNVSKRGIIASERWGSHEYDQNQ